MRTLITLTTDFGLADGFVGVLHGVIHAIAPDAHVIDLSHEIAPQHILEGALVLAHSVPYLPQRAIHLCIVDPGVGSARKPLALAVGETIFVAPDNGVVSLAVAEAAKRVGDAPRAFHLNNPRYWLPRLSRTFHARDIFAPVAAHLANGVPLTALGAPVEEWVTLTLPQPTRRADGAWVGHVIYIDRFGNLIVNLTESDLAAFDPRALNIEIGGRVVRGLVDSYAEVAPGELAALIGSSWKLEIAQREGNAAQALGVKVGEPVVVREAEDRRP